MRSAVQLPVLGRNEVFMLPEKPGERLVGAEVDVVYDLWTFLSTMKFIEGAQNHAGGQDNRYAGTTQ
jgi:hypothetical protein